MTPSNFNWFLHIMLFYHTIHVLERQKQKNNKRVDDGDDGDDEENGQRNEQEDGVMLMMYIYN